MGYAFDGADDRLTRSVTTFGSGWSGYSVVSWIKSNLTNSDQGWFNLIAPNGSDRFGGVRYDAAGASGGGTNLMKFGLTIGGGEVVVESANNTQTTNEQFIAGVWQSGEALEIWVDGVFSTPTFSQVGTGTISTDYNLLVLGAGAKETGAGAAFNGIVYEHRVYNRKLSQAEIETMFVTRGADCIVEGLELYYTGLEGAPGVTIPGATDSIKDLSNNNFDLTLAAGNPTFTETIY